MRNSALHLADSDAQMMLLYSADYLKSLNKQSLTKRPLSGRGLSRSHYPPSCFICCCQGLKYIAKFEDQKNTTIEEQNEDAIRAIDVLYSCFLRSTTSCCMLVLIQEHPCMPAIAEGVQG